MKQKWQADEGLMAECFICHKTALTKFRMCEQCHADEVQTCKYCLQEFGYEGNGSASCAMNEHINEVHHPVCEDCGCDDCTCEPPPTEEEIASWGGVVEENDDMVIYANGLAITKRVINVRVCNNLI